LKGSSYRKDPVASADCKCSLAKMTTVAEGMKQMQQQVQETQDEIKGRSGRLF
jgi:hypothetical protein